ncbi:MAG: hypothetical protein Q8O88_01550 [bacterium]|nr:hypothetical protein [bacterium]
MKRTIEIDDNLNEIIDTAKQQLKDFLLEFKEDNPENKADGDKLNGVVSDEIHNIADTSTPIYNYDIDGLYFLYGNKFDDAYENAGLGDGREDNYKQLAIYCYIEQELNNCLAELKNEIWDSD